MLKKCSDPNKIKPLFEGFDDSVLYSYFEGLCGSGFCDNEDKPTVAVVCGDFYFVSGDISFAEDIFAIAKDNKNVVFMPATDDWVKALLRLDHRLEVSERCRTSPPDSGFDRAALAKLRDRINEYSEYELVPLDEKLYQQSLESEWSQAFVFNFKSCEDYQNRGFGCAVTHGGRLICAASTYSVYSRGAEVEIAAHPDYRRQGLATIAGAAFILECVNRGLRPHWDAANEISLKIAKKLGFVFKEKYSVVKFKE